MIILGLMAYRNHWHMVRVRTRLLIEEIELIIAREQNESVNDTLPSRPTSSIAVLITAMVRLTTAIRLRQSRLSHSERSARRKTAALPVLHS
jgi:hypothetical protein